MVEHAGAGGLSVNDGLVNTQALLTLPCDMTTGEWLLAKSTRGNAARM